MMDSSETIALGEYKVIYYCQLNSLHVTGTIYIRCLFAVVTAVIMVGGMILIVVICAYVCFDVYIKPILKVNYLCRRT